MKLGLYKRTSGIYLGSLGELRIGFQKGIKL